MVTLLPIVVGSLLFLGLCLATWMITLSWMLVFSPTFMLCTSPAGCNSMVSGWAQFRKKLVKRATWRLPDYMESITSTIMIRWQTEVSRRGQPESAEV